MKIKHIITLIVTLFFISLFNVCYSQVIYYNGFETMPPGMVADADVKAYWQTRYAKGPDEGRMEVVNFGYFGRGARLMYPASANGTSDSGATWETDIAYEADDLYLAYWIKLDDDFQCVKGGKLPGLAGSESFPYGAGSWSARLMWREDCKLEWYLHDFALPNLDGDDPYRVFWDDFGAHARLVPGQWHHLELRVKLNTPGLLDGRLQGWLDGVMFSDDWENSGIRAVGENEVKINQLFFSTFFGGSSPPVSQWQPKADVYATFDEFTVSTQPIGMAGPTTTDEDADGVSDGADLCPGTRGEELVDRDGCPLVVSCECESTINIAWNTKVEIALQAPSACLQFDRDLQAATLLVWDSDAESSCDFRGLLVSMDGVGQLVVEENYTRGDGFMGSRLLLIPNEQGCPFVKLRAF